MRIATSIVGLALGLSFLSPPAAAQPAVPGAPNPDEILGNIVVVLDNAQKGRPLPKIAVFPSISFDMEDVTLRSVVRRDLDLCGEFEVLSDDKKPDGVFLSDTPVDDKAWAALGVEAVVRLTGKKAANGKAELRAQAYLVKAGPDAVFDKRFLVPASEVRTESHRIADLLIGALTGQNGGFFSHLTFVSQGKPRRAFTIDADGHNATPASPIDRTVVSPTFGKNEELTYAASVNNDEYKIFTASGGPFPVPVKGSVYGLAYNRDRTQVAVSIGVGSTIKLFSGPELASIKPVSDLSMALFPVFTPSGKLASTGQGKWGQRVFVEGKAITPDGLFASSPTFCKHPDGVRLIFAVGAGKNTDLAATGENGGGVVRLTQNQGHNAYPACSPDGRLVAFFSTRKSGEGPGLYVMRIDGGRAKRISTLLGDSLHWAPLAKSAAVEIAAK